MASRLRWPSIMSFTLRRLRRQPHQFSRRVWAMLAFVMLKRRRADASPQLTRGLGNRGLESAAQRSPTDLGIVALILSPVHMDFTRAASGSAGAGPEQSPVPTAHRRTRYRLCLAPVSRRRSAPPPLAPFTHAIDTGSSWPDRFAPTSDFPAPRPIEAPNPPRRRHPATPSADAAWRTKAGATAFLPDQDGRIRRQDYLSSGP